MAEELIDAGKAAELLGISKASVRNWIRHGYLQTIDAESKLFKGSEVLTLKEAIAAGQIDRLRKRANKFKAEKKFVPAEYIINQESRLRISHLIEYLKQHSIDMRMAILVLALNLFRRNGDLKRTEFSQLIPLRPDFFHRQSVYCELQALYNEILSGEKAGAGQALSREAEPALNKYIYEYTLPQERDVLGIVYQSLIIEGKKASLGSYFTPPELVDSMVRENIRPGQRVLDPCCGTGQFLLAFADYLGAPENILGMDIDPIAVRIARLNLLLQIPGEFRPQVFHLNTLRDLASKDQAAANLFDDFDLIATNPPWGAKTAGSTLAKLGTQFPEITSRESFSYFLRISLACLREGGMLSFVLPEAILNVRAHSDIRKYLLQNCQILRIECLGKKFHNVFSEVIRLDLRKQEPTGHEMVLIKRSGEEYSAAQQRFLANKWFVFDVYVNERDEQILRQVFQTEHLTLQDQADWALGIVTGDNKKFLRHRPEEGCEPIYKGSDVTPFTLKKANSYIRFSPHSFQQAAPAEKYRAREKLIYKFISRTPVFAYDDQGSLTLNSANILIPRVSYPLKVILALFNSSLYAFIYSKKFHSLKILRGDLEQLPLPLWKQEVLDRIAGLVDKIMAGEEKFAVLDTYLLEQFGISPADWSYIRSFAATG